MSGQGDPGSHAEASFKEIVDFTKARMCTNLCAGALPTYPARTLPTPAPSQSGDVPNPPPISMLLEEVPDLVCWIL